MSDDYYPTTVVCLGGELKIMQLAAALDINLCHSKKSRGLDPTADETVELQSNNE